MLDTVKPALMPGALDLMVLQTLVVKGRQHGYGIARAIEKTSDNELQPNQGTIHASLVRVARRGWIRSQWGTSANNRKARYYEIAPAGRRRLLMAARHWEWFSELMNRVLEPPKE